MSSGTDGRWADKGALGAPFPAQSKAVLAAVTSMLKAIENPGDWAEGEEGARDALLPGLRCMRDSAAHELRLDQDHYEDCLYLLNVPATVLFEEDQQRPRHRRRFASKREAYDLQLQRASQARIALRGLLVEVRAIARDLNVSDEELQGLLDDVINPPANPPGEVVTMDELRLERIKRRLRGGDDPTGE